MFNRGVSVALAAILSGALAACDGAPEQAVVDPAQHAAELAQSSIIVDTHIDVPYRINHEFVDVTVATEGGDFDYPRAVAGGLNAPFMSIYTPPESEADGTATALADSLIDMVEDIVARAPDKFAIAVSASDVRRQFSEGLISLPLGMENGAPVAGSMENLQHFYDRGIRYITLAHSKWNHISDSSYDDDKHWDGLSPFGEEVVRAMNDLGIMVDISHVSDAAFWDVMAITKTPVIASHSSARHFTPGFERNMDDAMIKRLGEGGGVIQINYGSSFLTEIANGYGDERKAAWKIHATDAGLEGADGNPPEDYRDTYLVDHPYPYATLAETLDHFDHVASLVGIDHVGIGSDYDGVGDSLPIGLKDVASYPNLVLGLIERGYSDEDIRKVLGENALRVWAEVEAYAAAN